MHSKNSLAFAIIARLDAVFNARVAAARNDRELDHWLREKHRIKQRLATKPDADLTPAALDALAQFGRKVQR